MKDKDGFLDAVDDSGGHEPEVAQEQDPGGGTVTQPSKAETQEPAQEQGKETQGKKGDVNVALRQAREEAKAERKRREDLEGRYGKLESRTNQILERYFSEQKPQQPQTQQQDADPEPGDDDPLGQLAWTRRKLRDVVGYLQGQHQTQSQTSQEDQIVSRQAGRYAMLERQYPELREIGEHVNRSLQQEFALAGYEGMMADGSIMPGSPAHIESLKHIRKIALWCDSQNKPIEEYFFEMARARGWQPKPQEQPQEQVQEQPQDDGRARDDKGRFVKQDVAAERTQQLSQAQNANRSLSQGSGSPTKKMTAKELAEMDEQEMWATFKKNGSRAFDRDMNFR